MARGKRKIRRPQPWRRCAVTGESGPTDGLIRFVIAPAGEVTPDLTERLPGRGIWVGAQRQLLQEAVRRNPFARAAKRADIRISDELVDQVEAGLVHKLIEDIGLARRAGQVTAGFEKCQARLQRGTVGARIEASDGTDGGRTKLRRLQPAAPVVSCLRATELGNAIGRDHAVHLVLEPGGITPRIMRDARRLSGFRTVDDGSTPTRHAAVTQTDESVQ